MEHSTEISTGQLAISMSISQKAQSVSKKDQQNIIRPEVFAEVPYKLSTFECHVQRFSFPSFQVLISLPVWVFFAVHFLLPFALCAGMFSEKVFYDNPSTTNVVIDAEVLEVSVNLLLLRKVQYEKVSKFWGLFNSQKFDHSIAISTCSTWDQHWYH